MKSRKMLAGLLATALLLTGAAAPGDHQSAGGGLTPFQITLTTGSDSDEMRFNWLTAPEMTDTQVRIRQAGEPDWSTVEGSGYLHFLTEGEEEQYSHKAVATGLAPDAEYEYQVGGLYSGQEFWSPIESFKVLPEPGGEFSLLVMCDVQAEHERELIPIHETLSYLMQQPEIPDALLFAGDIVDDGYNSRHWEDFFEAIEPWNRSLPSIFLPGNHEQKGDERYQQFAARYNLPNGFPEVIAGVSVENITGWFEAGDACIVVIATILDSKAMQEEFILAQLDWAEQIYEQSGKKWRIMVGHAGPYTIHKKGTDYRFFLNEGCDRLKVDLYLNGHDHMYMRGTVLGDEKVEPGQGTTYITGGAMGWNLFDKYSKKNDDYVEVYSDTPRPMCKMLTITPESLAITAYQAAEQEATGVENLDFTQWDVVDELVLTESPTGIVAGTANRTEENAAEETSPANDPAGEAVSQRAVQEVSQESAPPVQANNTSVIVILVIVMAAAAAAGYLFYRKKKSSKDG